MHTFKLHYTLIASLVFIIIIILAHILVNSQYQWQNHTISHLAAQGYEQKWLMQLGFIAFGSLIAMGVLVNGLELRTTPILLYGICIAFSGIFCAEPFFESLSFDIQEANFHSLCAQIAGICFSIGILIQIFYTKEVKLKWIHLLFFVLVIGISALFGYLKNGQGVAQRLLYLVSLYWLSCWFEI